ARARRPTHAPRFETLLRAGGRVQDRKHRAGPLRFAGGRRHFHHHQGRGTRCTPTLRTAGSEGPCRRCLIFPATTMSIAESFSTLEWGRVDLSRIPHLPVPCPGPRSKEQHARCTRYFKGLSSQVKLFPVAFESGSGCVLRDVDGNEYIDFSSGIYV